MAPSRSEAPRPDANNALPPIPAPQGPHPSYIQVAKPYIFERTVHECIAATGVDQLREDNIRLQGVTWIDNVRKALHLPVRTFNTAAIYYHKFRLVHPDSEYNYLDAAAAALFTACKIEDTLKKSRDILCSAYNLKLPPAEHLSSDDPVFESHSRGVIGLERLMLESSGFDFRNRHPQKSLMKLIKHFGFDKSSRTSRVAYGMSLDLYRTFAPLKQTSATMAFACLELAGRLLNDRIDRVESGRSYRLWVTSREEVMETMLDLLELYTHHRSLTSIGPDFALDLFLNIRIPLNQEADTKNLPRFTYSKPTKAGGANGVKQPNGAKHNGENHKNGPPANPLTPMAAHETRGKAGERAREGTVRFMLYPEQAKAERETVAEYYKVEMEEYEVDE
ncbi:RNA polymerase II C-terminal domain kinase beta subunit [Emmonsiellopsis sp. PD_33]|nr:RNA polymerase II C-terminal domain kinase beta subunit [Emmonsiellopsis sp. PD_33]